MLQISELKENDCHEMEGKFYCKCLGKEIEITYNKKLSFKFINQAVINFDSIYSDLLNNLCKYTVDYCKDTMDESPDVEYKKGLYNLRNHLDILNHIRPYSLKIELDADKTVYNLYCGCDWSEEDLQWVIRNNTVLYVGPWYDFDIDSPDLNDPFFNYCTRR